MAKKKIESNTAPSTPAVKAAPKKQDVKGDMLKLADAVQASGIRVPATLAKIAKTLRREAAKL